MSAAESPSPKIRSLSEGPPDAALVRRAAEGDEWAADTLYRRHVPRAMKTALRLLRNRAEAEDVVQDGFLLAFSRLGQLREPAAFAGWLLRIVVSGVHRRLRRRRIEPLDGFEREAAPDAPPAVRAELRLLDEVLDGLPGEQRTAWVLRYVLGHTVDEAADACECSRNTLKRRVAAAHAVVGRHVRMGSVDD
jgi:RNA polymerase sigma-70 factor (ECF subfamily)